MAQWLIQILVLLLRNVINSLVVYTHIDFIVQKCDKWHSKLHAYALQTDLVFKE